MHSAEQTHDDTQLLRILRRFHSRHNGRTLKRKYRAMCGPIAHDLGFREDEAAVQERRILIDLELPVVAACQLGHTGPDQ